MKTIKEVLMTRDGMTAEEADEAIQICKAEFEERVREGDMKADDVLMEHFDLEPDYIFDLFDS